MSEDQSDNRTTVGDEEEFPNWIARAVESASRLPGASERIAVWLPVIMAAWKSGRRGLELASALRSQLEAETPLEWPDELGAEFIETIGEIGDHLPGFEEVIPAASGLVEMGQYYIDPEVGRQLVVEAVERSEQIGTQIVGTMVEAAFFSSERDDLARRTRDLHELFGRLERLFDLAMQTWLLEDRQGGPNR